MEDAAFWRDQGVKFRERARTVSDRRLIDELLELAAICEEVAESIEDRAPAG
jgi:hypothetical protein